LTRSHDGGEIEIVDDSVSAIIVLSDHKIPIADITVRNPDLPEKVKAYVRQSVKNMRQ
jgi:hypothetical protein